MLILNTTYYVPDEQKQAFLTWLREVFLPEVEKTALVKHPRVLRRMGLNTDEQTGIAVQMEVETLADLRTWHKGQGEQLRVRLEADLGGQIDSFSTMMEVVGMERQTQEGGEQHERPED